MTNLIKGSGGGGCFRVGTLIQCENGQTTPIEKLNIGDEILSYNFLGEVEVSKVTRIHYHESPEPLILVKYWGGELYITPNHWVLNQYNSFVEAASMTMEDALMDGMGHLRPIISMESIGSESVYNLTVEPNHTFIANNIRVHNGGYRNRYPVAGAGGGGGKGGGGGASRVPVESPDNLHSRQYARVIDLVSEGEIEGLVNGLKSVYLEDTPIQSSTGQNNFTGITLVERKGTQDQLYIPGFPSVESEVNVSTEVIYSNPIIRSISNSNCNAIRITIGVPTLSYTDVNTGDLSGTSVQVAIDVNTNGGGWVETILDTISGKTTSRYQRNYRVNLSGNGPWDIRVRRVTADSTTSNVRNSTYWESYTEIIDSKLRYPNSALIALAVDSEQFNSIPRRGYEIKGLKVRIPSNYDPIARTYTGVWNGTFTIAWTNNPAWCFYDIITSDRYGLGEFIDETQVDKWALYSISQYCDQLVSNGFGGLEPRFTCNLYLQTREEAFKVVNSMASIFRGMVYWGNGAVIPVQDKPSDPVALFTKANVINGEFSYQGSSAKSRHTVALVSWNDPLDRYRQKIEYVEDEEGIARYGVIQSDLLAVGCTSRGQAHRLGRWLLYTERLESETITFTTGLDGLVINPGDIIKTNDPMRAGTRMGGRILNGTLNTIEIDSVVQIELGTTYTLWVTLPSGVLESRAITNSVGSTSTLNLSTNLSDIPKVNSIWVLAATNLAPETWRVVSITESDNSKANITALSYREDKYYAVENDLILEPLKTSITNLSPPDPVSELTVSESLYLIGLGVVGVKATVSWTPSARATYFIIKYQKENENSVEVTTNNTSVDVGPLSPGVYTFTVTAVNPLGKISTPSSKVYEVRGKLIPPADVTGFSLAALGNKGYFTWDSPTDLDVVIGGYLRVRYTPNTVNPTWNNAVDIGDSIPSSATSISLPLLDGTYMAKWVDSTGNHSINTSSISTDLVSVYEQNFVATLVEDPTFSGIRTNLVYDSIMQGLKLDTRLTIDQMTTNIDTWNYIEVIGGTALTAQYTFNNNLDLGKVVTSRVYSRILVELFDSGDFIDGKSNVDIWLSIDGSVIDNVNAVLMVRTTNDDPAGTPVWSNWQPFFVSEYTCRAYEFRLDVVNYSDTHNMLIKELSVTIDMPDVIDSGNDIESGISVYSVSFGRNFRLIPNISITAQNMATGDYYIISNKSSTGFDIEFRNSAGSLISRTFDWLVKGY